jgi:hypothetical protein
LEAVAEATRQNFERLFDIPARTTDPEKT